MKFEMSNSRKTKQVEFPRITHPLPVLRAASYSLAEREADLNEN
jgi:hypothetical protein